MAINKTFMKLLRLGLTPNNARGAHRDSHTMFVVHAEGGIEYAIDDLGYYEDTGDSTTIVESIENIEFVLDRHQELVQNLVSHFKEKLGRDVWMTVNAGMQVSISLGDCEGAFADVMLSFRDEKALEDCKAHIREMVHEEDMSEKVLEEQLKLYLMVILQPEYKAIGKELEGGNLIVRGLDDEDFGFYYDEDEDDEGEDD